MDSLDLLKRLSADDALRSALVQEASAQEARIDKLRQPAGGQAGSTDQTTQERRNEIGNAQAQLTEIRQNLATLRAPQLAILPGAFFWERTPLARVKFYDTWSPPYPEQFELVVGSTSYPLKLDRWRGDAHEVVRAAIAKSRAPVDVSLEPADELLDVVWEGAAPRLGPKDSKINLLRELDLTASFVLEDKDVPSLTPSQMTMPLQWQLVIGKGNARDSKAIQFTPCSRDNLLGALSAAIYSVEDAGVIVTEPKVAEIKEAAKENATPGCVPKPTPWTLTKGGDVKVLALKADRPNVESIGIVPRAKGDSPMLGTVTVAATRGRVLKSQIQTYAATNSSGLTLDDVAVCEEGKCSAADLNVSVKTINEWVKNFNARTDKDKQRKLSASTRAVPELVLTSRTPGVLELRSSPGDATSNLLREVKQVRNGWNLAGGQSLQGLMLTWVLLSLGAPFWYDRLKDLLKLRPSLAKTEEQQRTDRQTDTSASTTSTAK
jgi:hypothetical protein